jgi:hypothetical protein
MISTKSKLAVALGVAGAIALSMSTAEARTKQSSAKARAAVQDTVVTRPAVNQRSFERSFNYDPGFASGGINFRDGRGGANYNPNQ